MGSARFGRPAGPPRPSLAHDPDTGHAQTGLMEKFSLKKFGNDAELARAAAADWLTLAQQTRGRLSTAFSGGRIAKTHFQEIASQAVARGISLQNVDFFWA